MPATTDHDRRDAYAAAYAEIQLELGKHRRRLFEKAKTDIDTQIADAAKERRAVDGTKLGRAAATAALDHYLGPDVPEPIDATAAAPAALDAGAADS